MTKHAVIVSQGRVADRTDGALVGARLTGDALASLLGVDPVHIGSPTAARDDDWTESLLAANTALTELRSALGRAFDIGSIPIFAMNTCAASLATLPEVAERFPDAVVLWIDAHGDFNTPDTTGSGYLGGMALSGACGLWNSGHGAGLNPAQVALVGARDIDEAERELLTSAGVRIFAPSESTPEAVSQFVADRPLWVHIDWDVLEPGYIPAAYKVADGLLPHQISAIFAALPTENICGVELAEFEAGEPSPPGPVSVELILGIFQHLIR